MGEDEKPTENELLQFWEKAYREQANDAAVGRLFRGIIHNLNGVIQTFTMQGELFAMMFEQAGDLIEQMVAGHDGTIIEPAVTLQRLLTRRAASIPQIEEKVAVSRRLLTRVTGLSEQLRRELPVDYTINTVVENEVEFLSADPFFKHKVAKNIQLGTAPPVLSFQVVGLHQSLYALLTNAIDALQGIENPTILVQTVAGERGWELRVEDNGPGIEAEDAATIFSLGFTRKEGHAGVGLYLAKKTMVGLGGALAFTSEPGCTRFILSIPC